MNKSEQFSIDLQELAAFAKLISHPARLAILAYLSKSACCISGDISDALPLSRPTVSQHLKELRDAGLIQGEIDGLKINYCLAPEKIQGLKQQLDDFLTPIIQHKTSYCGC